MTLGAKASSVNKSRGTVNGDGTLGSGYPQVQIFRGQGNLDSTPAVAGANNVPLVAVAEWSFARDGSPAFAAAGTGGMGLGVFIPKNALILGVSHLTVEEVTGPTNTSLSLESDGDLVADGTLDANSVDVEGEYKMDLTLVSPDDTQAIVTTAVREPVLRFTVANATTGKLIYFIWYIVVDQSNED